MRVINHNFISQDTFDAALKDFHDSAEGKAVRDQAVGFVRLFRGSSMCQQMHSGIAYAAKTSGHTSKEQISEIAFVMGLHFGFQLASNYPEPKQ
jgi:hypothetical protein